jgi:DNA polymerase
MRDEIEACSPYLFQQIEMIKPAMVCALGRYAAATLLGRAVKITQEHGIWMDYRGRPFLIALHPSAAMRSPRFREQFEHDIAVLAERYHALRKNGSG